MNSSQLKGLLFFGGLITLIAIVLTLISAVNLNNSSSEQERILPIEKNRIESLKIKNPSGNFEIKKVNETWRVNDFIADQLIVNGLVDQLLETSVQKTASSNKENHPTFDLTEEKGNFIRVYSGGKEVAALIFGKDAIGSTSYFRFEGNDNVYIINSSFTTYLGYTPDQYRNREIANINPAIITTVRTSKIEVRKEDSAWKASGDLDQTKAEEFIKNIASLIAINISDVTAVDDSSKIFQVGIDYPHESTLNYYIYKINDNYVAKRDGDETIYEISSSQFELINKSEADLR